MKIILSRKGFDSQYGKQASPILPDGTMLSFPIPSEDGFTYSDIRWNGKPYIDLIQSLKPQTSLTSDSHCHLDPDLRKESIDRLSGWLPAFGQKGSSLTELRAYNITIGDLFLFFGWFKETEYRKGRLMYKYKASNLHVIFGYLQIGSIVSSADEIYDWLRYHPHSNLIMYNNAWEKGRNAIFIAAPSLSFAPELSGSGTFRYDKKYVLTKEGCSRSKWFFPESMKGIPISHNPNGWKGNYFQSATRGQEFVMDASPSVMDWVKDLFDIKNNNM